MLKNAIEQLDQLITDTLHPDNTVVKKGNDAAATPILLLKEATGIKENIRRALIFPASGGMAASERQLQVRLCQTALVYLSDILHQYQQTNPAINVYKAVQAMLQELMVLIEQRLPDCFNKDEKIPAIALSKLQEQIDLKNINDCMDGFALAGLADIICHPFECIYNEPVNFFCSCRYAAYLQLMHEEITAFALSEQQQPDILSWLVSVNFNSTAFKAYYIDLISHKVKQVPTIKGKLEKLLFYQKQIGQVVVKENIALHHLSASVKEAIISWLQEEITYLQQVQAMAIPLPERLSAKETGAEEGLYYKMTVEEIALFKRIMKDSGLLSNKNITVLMKDVAKTVHSVNQYEVSWQNLYNSFYKYELSTAESLQDKLFLMLNTVKKAGNKLKQQKKG